MTPIDPQRLPVTVRTAGAAVVLELADLPDGLHYRTGRGPGRATLLAAYT